MGLYFRKSIGVGPFRFNLSGSGVGMSVGVRGLRIGTGPRGNYIRAGRGGIYYQASLSPRHSRTYPAATPTLTPSPHQIAPSFDRTLGSFEAIDAGSSLSIRDSSSEELLANLNETRQHWRLLPAILLLGVCLCVAAITIPLPIWQTAVVVALLVLSAWIVHIRDVERTTTVLLYDLDDVLVAAYTDLNTAFDKAGASMLIWHVKSQAKVLDRKYHAGAASVINSDDTRLTKDPPPRVKTNIQPPVVRLGWSTLYLLPDRILFLDSRGFGAIDYRDLQCSVEYGSFILDSPAPSDAQVISYTWRYVNRNGGPDRRFANNPQLPVIRIADVHFATPTGLAGILKFSNVPAAETLVEGLRRFADVLPKNSDAGNDLIKAEGEPSASPSAKSANWLFPVALLVTLFATAYVAFEWVNSPIGSSLINSQLASPEPSRVSTALNASPSLNQPLSETAAQSATRTTAEGIPAGSTLGKPVTSAPTVTPAPEVKQGTSVKRHVTPATRPEAAKLRVANDLTPLSSAIAKAVIFPIPVYPYEAKRQRITGDGVCVITVDTASGKVTDATMEQSTGNAILDKSTTETLRQWRFKPGTVSRVRVPVIYAE